MISKIDPWVTLNILLYVLASHGILQDELLEKSCSQEECTSDECKRAASVIQFFIDEREKPCNNFYSFACGGFVKKAEIPMGKLFTTPLTSLKDKVFGELRKNLKTSAKSGEPRTFNLVKNFYNACMNLSLIESHGSEPLLRIIKVLGGWPVTMGDSWDGSKFDWLKADVKLRHLGFHPKYIFNIFVFNDPYNSSMNTLYIDPLISHINYAALKLGLRNSVVRSYRKYIIEVAKFFGADEIQAFRESRQIVLFERRLVMATSYLSPILNASKSNTEFTIKELKSIIPQIDWRAYLNGLSQPIVSIRNSDVVRIGNLNYLMKVKHILRKTPKRVVANYLVWRSIAESIPHTHISLRVLEKHFEERLNYERKKITRWRECINLLSEKSGLPVGISSLYVKNHFKNSTRTSVQPILQAIVDEFQDLLNKCSWMDEKTRNAALRKSKFMRKVIAYPDELLNDETIDEYTSDLKMSRNDHFKNILSLRRFHFDYMMSGLFDEANKSLWVTLSDSTVTNAYYYSIHNTLALLAAILQPPIFHEEWPDYMKFGSVGFILGHEMMHAYDSKNSRFDETGSLRPWISKAVEPIYHDRIKCFISQYDKYRDDVLGLQVNGSLTVNENLADAVGMKVSYYAYQKWRQMKNTTEPYLPGLNYSPEQLFWISSMFFLCTKSTDYQRMNTLLTDVHTSSDFRVIGTLSNSRSFPKAFECEEGSIMNPLDKCVLW